MQNTSDQYHFVVNKARNLFENKTTDYGTAWRILRPISLTDQIFIKANRIRTLQETGENKVGEGVEDEFIGILNYSIIALIQLELPENTEMEMEPKRVMELYDFYSNQAYELMQRKNHDYGEAWRDMRQESLTDLILMKVLRTKQIEDNDGATLVSEGIDANYYDMINYSIFALIKLFEEQEKFAREKFLMKKENEDLFIIKVDIVTPAGV